MKKFIVLIVISLFFIGCNRNPPKVNHYNTDFPSMILTSGMKNIIRDYINTYKLNKYTDKMCVLYLTKFRNQELSFSLISDISSEESVLFHNPDGFIVVDNVLVITSFGWSNLSNDHVNYTKEIIKRIKEVYPLSHSEGAGFYTPILWYIKCAAGKFQIGHDSLHAPDLPYFMQKDKI